MCIVIRPALVCNVLPAFERFLVKYPRLENNHIRQLTSCRDIVEHFFTKRAVTFIVEGKELNNIPIKVSEKQT